MRISKKTAGLMAGVVGMAALYAVWIGLKKTNESRELRQEEEAAGDAILNLSEDTVSSLAFMIGDTKTAFLADDEDGWILEGDDTFPVNSQLITNLLAEFMPLRAVRTLEEVDDADEYGMDAPQNEFIIFAENGGEQTLTIGDTNEGTGDDYAMKNNDGTVIYTISSSLRYAVYDDLYDYAVSETLPSFSSDEIAGFELSKGEEKIVLEKKEDIWYMAETSGNNSPSTREADSETIEACVENLDYPGYSGYVDHNCEDGKAYGLDVGLTVTVFYGEEEEALTEDTSESVTEGVFEDLSEAVGEKETDLFSGKDSLVLHVGDPTGEGGYYVQLEGSKEVHIFSEEKLDGLISLL